MSIQEKIAQLTSVAEQVAQQQGFVLVDLRMTQQGKRRTLEVTIHRPDGRVSLDDCEQMSRDLEALLDSQAPPIMDGAYLLEVQSPGIDRQLRTEREFAVFTGQTVQVKSKEKIEGLGACFEGELLKATQDAVTIKNPHCDAAGKKKKSKDNQLAEPPSELTLQLEKIISVRLHPQIDTTKKPVELGNQEFLFDLNGTDN